MTTEEFDNLALDVARDAVGVPEFARRFVEELGKRAKPVAYLCKVNQHLHKADHWAAKMYPSDYIPLFAYSSPSEIEELTKRSEPVAWIDGSDLRAIAQGNSAWAHPEDQGRMIPIFLHPAPRDIDGMADRAEPVAYATGTAHGYFTYSPFDPATVLPDGMAFYRHPASSEIDDLKRQRDDLLEVVKYCRYVFSLYVEIHNSKVPPDTAKAIRNAQYRDQCDAVIVKIEGQAAIACGADNVLIGWKEPEDFQSALQHTINRFSMENSSNTPDFILAQYMQSCLAAFDTAVQQRENWYGRDPRPSFAAPQPPGEET